MKNKLRYLLVISAIIFWASFTTSSVSVILLLCLFGLGIGLLIARATPLSQLSWPTGILKPIFWILGAVLSVIVCFLSASYFHHTLRVSSVHQSIIAQFVPNVEAGLIGIAAVLGVGMFPSVFDVLCRALYHTWGFFRNIRWRSLWKYTGKTVTVKSSIRSAVTVCVSLLLCAAIGIGLLTAVFCIPVDSIDQNAAKSALTIQKEGTYHSISPWFHSLLDNWTDSIILMEAAKAPDTTALDAAVNAFHGAVDENATPAENLTAHYIDGAPYTTFVEYCRYWHGYLVILKPLLCFLDYNAIRILNGIVQVFLVTAICLLMRKKGLGSYVIPMVLTYLMLMPVALACSFQFSTCFYTIALGLLAMLLIRPEKLDRSASMLFLAIGIATAYFDFLTYPIATFGLPVLVLLVLQNNRPIEERLFMIIKCGLFWCIGFGGMWASKWIISYLVCGYNFSQLLTIFAQRTSMAIATSSLSVFDVEASNYSTFLQTPISYLVLLLIGIRYRQIQKAAPVDSRKAYRTVFPYLLVACAPIIWFAFAASHSAAHYWFTNKACSVTLLGILFAVTSVQALQKDQAPTIE